MVKDLFVELVGKTLLWNEEGLFGLVKEENGTLDGVFGDNLTVLCHAHFICFGLVFRLE